MTIAHRYNSKERQHFLLKQHYSFKLKPRLLYAGELKKSIGWKENPHTHDFCEILFVVDGEGSITVNGRTRMVSKGDIIIYNPNVIHSEKSNDLNPMSFIFYAIDKFEITDLKPNFLLPEEYDFIFFTGEYYRVMNDISERIIYEFKKKEMFYVEISQNLVRTFLMYIFRIVNVEENSDTLTHSSNILSKAISYIDKNYHKEITLDGIAEICYVNKFYLSHIFVQFKGVTIGKYVLQKRISAAKHLLENSALSVADISESVGFNDCGYFCRAFKKVCSMTPLQYRKINMNK